MRRLSSDPGGVAEISRWSSAATPPVGMVRKSPHPGGMAESVAPSGIPPGCEVNPWGSVSGGVAALNHRLMSFIPPGCWKALWGLSLSLMCWIAFGSLIAHAEEAKPPVPPKVALCSPLAVASGATTKVTLRGWLVDKATAVKCDNDKVTLKILSQGAAAVPGKQDAKQIGDQQLELEITVAAEAQPGRVLLTVVAPDGESKPHALLVGGDLPVIAETEPNDGFRQAQAIAPSQIIDGQIHGDGNVDVFAFELTEKTNLSVEVQAQQLGSGLDSILTLYHAAGSIVASNDDSDKTTDSKLEAPLEPGRYFVCLQDAHDRGGAAHPYRLVVRSVSGVK